MARHTEGRLRPGLSGGSFRSEDNPLPRLGDIDQLLDLRHPLIFRLEDHTGHQALLGIAVVMIVGVDQTRDRGSPLQVNHSRLGSLHGSDALVGPHGQKLPVTHRKGLHRTEIFVHGQNLVVVSDDVRIGQDFRRHVLLSLGSPGTNEQSHDNSHRQVEFPDTKKISVHCTTSI